MMFILYGVQPKVLMRWRCGCRADVPYVTPYLVEPIPWLASLFVGVAWPKPMCNWTAMSLLRDQLAITDYRLTNDIVTEESLTSAETILSTILQVAFATCFFFDCYVQFIWLISYYHTWVMIFLNHYNSAYFAVYDLEIPHTVDQVIYHRCDTLVLCSLGCFSFYPLSRQWVLSKRKRDTGNV